MVIPARLFAGKAVIAKKASNANHFEGVVEYPIFQVAAHGHQTGSKTYGAQRLAVAKQQC